MTTLTIELDNTTIQALEQLANHSKVTVSEWVRNLVQQGISLPQPMPSTPTVSIADYFAELREILNGEELITVERTDRANDFMDVLDAH